MSADSDVEQDFSVFCECPRCHDYALHYVEIPSDYEPKVVDQHTIRTWSGQAVMVDLNEYDAVDERDWEIARVCRSCNHRFGQR